MLRITALSLFTEAGQEFLRRQSSLDTGVLNLVRKLLGPSGSPLVTNLYEFGRIIRRNSARFVQFVT